MKCCNCQTDIPPAWKAAIAKNLCPGCGEAIMNDSMQELLVELKSALEAMPNDPEGLAGWLLSNYQLIKIGTGEPVQEFYGTKKNNQQSSVDPLNLKIAPNIMQAAKQAKAKPEKDYKQLLLEIQKNGGLVSDNEPEIQSTEDINDPETAKFALQALKNMQPGILHPPKLPPQNLSEKALETDANHPLLQIQRLQRLEKQQELGSGGSIGKIRRGD